MNGPLPVVIQELKQSNAISVPKLKKFVVISERMMKIMFKMKIQSMEVPKTPKGLKRGANNKQNNRYENSLEQRSTTTVRVGSCSYTDILANSTPAAITPYPWLYTNIIIMLCVQMYFNRLYVWKFFRTILSHIPIFSNIVFNSIQLNIKCEVKLSNQKSNHFLLIV